MLIILFGVYLVYETSQATFWKGEARADIQQEARSALERMRRELRMAGYDPSVTGQAAVQNATATVVEFITDADDNNISDLVRYDRDATTRTIRRSVRARTGGAWGAASVTTLAANVDSVTFQYFPSSVVPGLKRIRVTIQESEAIPGMPTEGHLVSTDVFLRNL
jgi:Tfp pilus assembly protein PilW